MNKFFLFTIIAATSTLFCEEASLTEKIRISPKEIHVNDDGIFIHLNGKWISFELFQDSKGLSIKPLGASPDFGFTWRCTGCNTWNFGSDNSCRNCCLGRHDYD